MFRISCWFLVGFFFSVHCLQRQFLYSRLDKQVANSSLAVFLSGASSLAHCAGHCLVDEYCVEILYSETSQRCIGLHCVQKGSSSYQYVVLESLQCLHYEKDINWVEHSGHYYFYGEEELTWAVAKLECQKLCAYLVEIETQEESEWLAATFIMKESCPPNVYTTCSAWTGGNDLDSEGQYVWDHSNTTIGFSYWQPTEPSLGAPDKAAVRDCIDVFRNGKWNDRVCTHLKPFICEKNA
ncbi:lectin BRA-3-like [Crassostrea angulata]|uniref:lectin BRA-3-like n=1 Tax=Magallana angulata TaxID=2784310 RepID=UPI0022B1AC3F|nr:lectin BRA-3-like [Crassostrea angulata]